MLFQDIGTYAYLTNGSVPVSGVDDAADLQDSLVSLNKVLCTVNYFFSFFVICTHQHFWQPFLDLFTGKQKSSDFVLVDLILLTKYKGLNKRVI